MFDVGHEVVDEAEDEHRSSHRQWPADHAPDVVAGASQSDEAEYVLRESAAQKESKEAGKDQAEKDESHQDVVRLAAQEASPLLDLEDDVERAARGLERTRRPVEREGDRDEHANRGGAAAAQGLPKRSVDRVDRGRRDHVAQIADDRVVGLRVLTDQAEERET